MLFALEEPVGDTLRAQVIKVFDGDGFLARASIPPRGIEVEIAVRCGFIDAPEMKQSSGREARDFLQQQIGDQWLDLGLLIKMDTGGMIDRHHRIVSVPYLWSDPHGWRNIELEMILNGWAWVLDRYGPPEHYYDALEDAQRQRRGMWARDDNVSPWEFKRQTHQNGRKPRFSPRQPELFSGREPACPQEGCKGHLVQRSGRFGTFYGCSEFPSCRYSCSSAE